MLLDVLKTKTAEITQTGAWRFKDADSQNAVAAGGFPATLYRPAALVGAPADIHRQSTPSSAAQPVDIRRRRRRRRSGMRSKYIVLR